MISQFPRLFAHRGAAGYAPENTLASFKKAKELGAEWVELDIQLTADNHLIVFHDDTLERTSNGKGVVTDFTLAELKKLDAGSWYSNEYTDEKISTLSEVLDYLTSASLNVNIEIKNNEEKIKKTVETLIELLATYQPKLEIIISSFSLEALQLLNELYCEFPLALLAHDWSEAYIKKAVELQCAAFHLNHKLIKAPRLKQLKATGMKVGAYTVNHKKTAQSYFDMGIDGIFTDYFDKLNN